MSDGDKVEGLPPPELREAIAALWQVRRLPGPENYLRLFRTPEFARLRDACSQLYPEVCHDEAAMLDFALAYALHSLGLPGRPPPAARDLALPAGIAAARLHAAFKQKQGRRIYLCPLDQTGDLPPLTFGPNRIAKFTPAELEKLVDQPRLRRINRLWAFDAARFSKFTWLAIEETYPLARTAGERAEPGAFTPPLFVFSSPPIEPHRRRFPAAVENALFAMLLAPWEEWIRFSGWTWHCFEVPWVYEVNDDLFVRPQLPPLINSLSWTESEFDEEEGEIPGTEEPRHRELKTSEADLSESLNDSRWTDVLCALESPLFETPVAYFFVKAFIDSEDPLDEFITHLIAIEAALGLESDPHNRTTACVARRVSKLLGTKGEGEVYRDLFKLRSRFLHGRKMEAIPADNRLGARRLARRIVQKLVEAAVKQPCPDSREYYLKALEW